MDQLLTSVHPWRGTRNTFDVGSTQDMRHQADHGHDLELAIAIADYIDHFYNPSRRHSSLGYLTPNEFERLHSTQPPATLS